MTSHAARASMQSQLSARPTWRPALRQSRKHNHRHVKLAASASGDPHSVLGIPKNADSARVEQAYRKMRREAEISSDKELLKRVEEAHNAIFMSSLSSRLSGEGPVDKKVRTADRTSLFPWRPKITLAPSLIVKAAIGVYIAQFLFELFIKAKPEGAISAGIIGVVMNTWKQYQLFAAASGVFAFWAIPTWIVSAMGMQLPKAAMTHIPHIITGGTILTNCLTVIFLR